MKFVPHTNSTENTIHVGGVTIPSGETRDVDPSLLPGWEPEGEARVDLPPDPIADMLKGNVKDVAAALELLSDDELHSAAYLEERGQARKSLLELMAAEKLQRAAGQGGDQDLSPAASTPLTSTTETN
ncbi:hypothetical protein [Collimonas pratensis]|uniref:Uncharacterized protein n=1 Tax=Collimonas pratensis TaxID=279113 RepID=A0ABM5Z495_9BURK|nr:hypothetical protein [Collimonas pratensis]AMP13672.1 hypothetical protein CPter291_1398 [Collimonas pratensis]